MASTTLLHNIVLGASGGLLDDANVALNVGSVISGSGALTFNTAGTGAIALYGADTYTGGTTLGNAA